MKKSTMLLAGSCICLLCSCYSYKEISTLSEIEKYEGRKSIYVLKARTDTDSIFFTERLPGKLSDGHISGIFQYPLVHLKTDSIFYKNIKYKRIIEYVYMDGVRFDALMEKDQVYVYNKLSPVSIPYEDLKAIHLKIFHPGSTAALVGGTSAGFGFLIAILLMNMTFDGGLGGI